MPAGLGNHVHRIVALGAAMVFAFGTLQQVDAGESSPVSYMSIEELKGVYLGCEQAATASRQNGGDVMYCSLIYEELKDKAFAGEFMRIRSWLVRHSIPLG